MSAARSWASLSFSSVTSVAATVPPNGGAAEARRNDRRGAEWKASQAPKIVGADQYHLYHVNPCNSTDVVQRAYKVISSSAR